MISGNNQYYLIKKNRIKTFTNHPNLNLKRCIFYKTRYYFLLLIYYKCRRRLTLHTSGFYAFLPSSIILNSFHFKRGTIDLAHLVYNQLKRLLQMVQRNRWIVHFLKTYHVTVFHILFYFTRHGIMKTYNHFTR